MERLCCSHSWYGSNHPCYVLYTHRSSKVQLIVYIPRFFICTLYNSYETSDALIFYQVYIDSLAILLCNLLDVFDSSDFQAFMIFSLYKHCLHVCVCVCAWEREGQFRHFSSDRWQKLNRLAQVNIAKISWFQNRIRESTTRSRNNWAEQQQHYVQLTTVHAALSKLQYVLF